MAYRSSTYLLTAVLTSSLASACSKSRDAKPLTPPGGTFEAGLKSLTSCADAEASARRRALYSMSQQLYVNETQALALPSCDTYDPAIWEVAQAPSEAPVAGGATQTSSTNNQVAGVGEADFVKNDNQYIYAVADGAFHIVTAWPAASMHEVARLDLSGTPRKLLVDGDRALIYVAQGTPAANAGQECTYGYDCEPTGDGTATQVLVFDITDRSAPVQLRSLTVTGALIAARRIGNIVHTVVTNGAPSLGLPTWLAGLSSYCMADAYDTMLAFMLLEATNAAAIQAHSFADTFPHGQDSANPNQDLYGSCAGYLESGLDDGAQLTSLVSLDVTTNALPQTTVVLSRPGFIYASAETLYMAVRHQRPPTSEWIHELQDFNKVSTVHAFALNGNAPAATYAASGVVPGHVINQFSMDAWNGNLRVAASLGTVVDIPGTHPGTRSSMTVLAQQGKVLARVGGIDGIAPNEDIRAVRFDGPRSYLCTFKMTDPLFVLDLENAQTPSILGELQIPGFSTYMQMIDATHLLTIGFDADDRGSYAVFTGMLLQIFDVHDPANPNRTFVETIGIRGTGSAALTDHLAFNYFAAEHLLALPLTVCQDTSSSPTFNGLRVYDVDPTQGFHLRGDVPLLAGTDTPNCSNWWTHSTSSVKRSVVMDAFAYSISDHAIQVDGLDTLGTNVAQVSFTGP